MFDRLDDLLIRYEELLEELNSPDVAMDQNRFRKLMKEQADLTPLVDAYKEYKKANQDVEDSLALLEEESDEEMRDMAKEELADAKKRIEEMEQQLKILLLPKDPNDDKNVMVEIRAGAGGDEAALFASELYRMYVHFAESNRWKTELVSVNENGIGGFKEVVFMVTGQGAYSKMKYESGVHRVQRVPETESGGRIHTSTASVAVMPEAEEFDVVIDDKDIRIDVMRASGNGGQCVNTTDSAVRLTHMPTGIVIYSQTEKSQLQNKEKAFRLLRSKLYDMELEKRQNQEAEERRSQIGTGDRSEKIRTYNFPQGRVTEHRIKLTLYKIDSVMNGELNELIKAAIPAKMRANGGHPSKRTFQAIRIECNHELDVLKNSLDELIGLLNPGGRICIITFHSLEDRIVKSAFRKNENPCTCPPDFPVCVCGKESQGKVITRKPILPGAQELETNSRSKSAKLRIFEKKE